MTDEVEYARELYTRLSAGDTVGYGLAETMAKDIRETLKKAGADSASLDPSGKKSVADMDRALNAATSASQVKHARELYTRLSTGYTAGYGLAETMAKDIRETLKKAGADSASLDPSGKKSVADMDRALNAATSASQVKHARELYTRLSTGYTAGYGLAETMAKDIRETLKKAGADSASLDPSGKKSVADMDRALNAATSALTSLSPKLPSQEFAIPVKIVRKEPQPGGPG